jgi:hypothetical protein
MTDRPTTTSLPGAPGSRAFRWPGDRRIAAIVNIAYEAWGDDRAPGIGPMGNPLPPGAFDTNSRSWGDYGADHGIHRLLRILAGAQVRGSVMVSGILADRFPANVQAIADGGHEIIAHSYSQDLVPASRVVGEAVPNRFRTPYGPGWALVGDAGYAKDPVTAQGITDAFHDAEMCAGALDTVWRNGRGYDQALGGYQQRRDERVLPMYEFTGQLADLAAPPPPQMQQLLAAIAGNHKAMDEFASMFAGALPVPEFFNPAHIASLPGADTELPR